jgi:hypothetical protein
MDTLPPPYRRGIELFNAARYFDCHEALEEIWLRAEGREREFLHALIQAAVALHHLQQGNDKGARSVYERSRRKLETLPPRMMALDTVAFAAELDAFFATALRPGQAWPPLPQIRLEDTE